jgi:hypothetical protein
MTVALPTICEACKRYNPADKTCKAFPDGIPTAIHPMGLVDHRKPYEGDNAVRFDPMDNRFRVEWVLDYYDNLMEV